MRSFAITKAPCAAAAPLPARNIESRLRRSGRWLRSASGANSSLRSVSWNRDLADSGRRAWLVRMWRVWENASGRCVINRSEISHGSNGTGYNIVRAIAKEQAVTPWGTFPCEKTWDRGPGYLRSKIHFVKHISGNTWGMCYDSGWYYNSTTANEFDLYKNWGSGGPPCGSGTYATHGHTGTKLNGTWHGGSILSGGHQLPI
jgi:hypothetical protein